MLDSEVKKYKCLNQIASSNGIVVFGGTSDVNIPLGELKQAFSLKDHIYNRSFSDLSVSEASKAFDECVEGLCPETVFVHIGEADISLFEEDDSAFEKNYQFLLKEIKNKNKDCRIVIVSLKNYDGDASIAKLNKRLKYIADSGKFEFEDISSKRIWDIKENSQVTSLLYDIGFDRPLNIRRPVYNLVRILFCYDN